MFIEYSQKLLKNNGKCGLIIPNSWLMVYSGEGLRRYLLENISLEKIVSLKGKSFEDASVETVILIDKKIKANENTELEILLSNDINRRFKLSHKLKQKDFYNSKPRT